MTWSDAEAVMIKSLLTSVEATDKNVNEIKEAIVGSLANGGKAGLQDRVRELDSGIDRLHGDFNVHRKANQNDHALMRRGIVGVGLLTIVGLIFNFEKAGALLGTLIELLIRIFT